MSNIYILTSNGELYHHGIKGQKWGVRRFQNRDGSLTAAGKKRLAAKSGEYLKGERFTPNPGTSKDSFYRSLVANQYLRDRSTQLDSLELAESYLDKYSSATLRDLGMTESESARAYVRDLFSKSSKIQALREEEAGRMAKEAELADELAKVPENDRKAVTAIARRFKEDGYGWYESESKTVVDGEDVFLSVRSSRGSEVADSVAATNFLKRYDLAKARDGVTKEFYDSDEYGWIDKDEISRDEFVSRIKPQTIFVSPKTNTYEVWWDDDGMYGYHAFTDEGSMDTMKVDGRSLNG